MRKNGGRKKGERQPPIKTNTKKARPLITRKRHKNTAPTNPLLNKIPEPMNDSTKVYGPDLHVSHS